ncbi:MAG: DUF6599 family protein [Planctomycetota bacterium]|jgi:hypothetical protein
MRIAEQKPRRTEKVISICLLVILVFVGAGVISKQFDYDMKRYGIVQPESEFELQSQVPAGFEGLSETENYAPETLYLKINGKAPLYLDAGFVELRTQLFMNTSNENLWMEVFLFDMGKTKNAFSVFSVQRREDAEPLGFLPINFGYKTSNGLYFSHGKYNVEIVGSAESDVISKALDKVAQKLVEGLTIDENDAIQELDILTGESIVEGSIKFELNGAFGYEGLNNTFTGRYKSGDENITVFFSKRSNENEAQELFKSYYDFLIENGYKDSGVEFCGVNGKVVDYYDFKEIIFRDGVYVGGVHEAEDQETAIQTALILKERINEAK